MVRTKDGRQYIAPANQKEAKRKYDWDKSDVIPLNDAPYQIQNIIMNGHLHNTARMNVVSYLLGNGYSPHHVKEVVTNVRWEKPLDGAAVASMEHMIANRYDAHGWAGKAQYWDENLGRYKPLAEAPKPEPQMVVIKDGEEDGQLWLDPDA